MCKPSGGIKKKLKISRKNSLFNSQTKEKSYFKDDDDFINNAKIGGKYLKSIWEQTTDRYWLQ